MMRRIVLLTCAIALISTGTAGAQTGPRSWAHTQIATVVEAGLLGTSVPDFRPQDALTQTELAVALSSLGAVETGIDRPDGQVSIRELDARLVSLLGLRPEARAIRLAAVEAGLAPPAWLGTETIARVLGLRVNHPVNAEHLELQLHDPATRAEAAYSLARVLALSDGELDAVRRSVATFQLPELTVQQQAVLRRALKLVGSPYVWAGASERPQRVGGRDAPGGFDCSGLVWRVYKLQPFDFAPALAGVLRGRTSFAMSGEAAPSARIGRADLRPGDVVFFGPNGGRSRPSQVGHMGIYVGGGWFVHSSTNGTTLQPLSGWHERTFAWARRPLAEAGVTDLSLPRGAGGIPKQT